MVSGCELRVTRCGVRVTRYGVRGADIKRYKAEGVGYRVYIDS